MPIMPKSPLSPTTVHSPLSARSAAQPYKLQALSKDADGSGKPAHAPSGILKAPKLSAPPGPRLAISSTDVNQPAYWSISGDFLRTGVHVYTKSGKHVVETPLAENLPKPPRWLQIQFNVLVKEESSWKCEMVMKDLGGISCAKDLVVAVQTGGKSVDPVKKVFSLHLIPPASRDQDDDPRIAISYFIEYTEKRYKQALDGTLPYQFMLQRVSGAVDGSGAGKKKQWWKK